MNNELFNRARALYQAEGLPRSPLRVLAVPAGRRAARPGRDGPSVPPDRQLPHQAQGPGRGHPRLHAGHRRRVLRRLRLGELQPGHGLRRAARLRERGAPLRDIRVRRQVRHALQGLHRHGQRPHEAGQVRRGGRGVPRGRARRGEPRSHQGASEPWRVLHGAQPPGRRRGLLRKRPAVRHGARHPPQALREPGAGLRGLRPDAEGRERLRAGHFRQDLLPVGFGERRLPAARSPPSPRARPSSRRSCRPRPTCRGWT